MASDTKRRCQSGGLSSSSKALAQALGQLVVNSTQDVLEKLLDSIPDLIWLKDSQGTYLFCNSAFERFFGAKRAVILGKTDYDFVDRELADFFRKNDMRSVEQGKPSINEEWLTFATDGYTGLFETIKSPLFNPDGTHLGVLGVAREITKLHEAKERLRERQQLLETIISLAGSPIVLVDPATGKMREFNEAAYTCLGYSPEEFSRLTIFDIDEQSVSEVSKNIQHILDKGSLTVETRLRHRDGHFIDVIINTSVIEQYGAHYIESLWTDVSDIKQAERDAKRQQAMLARTEHLARLGSWEWNVAIDQVTWSEELFHLFGLDPTMSCPSFAEQERLQIFHPADIELLKKAVLETVETGSPYEIDIRIKRTDGVTRNCVAYGECEFDSDGNFKGLNGYLKDITEQREAARALQESESNLARAQRVAHVGSWSVNTTDGHLRWSDETYRIFGVAQGQTVTYDTFISRVHPLDIPDVEAAWKRAIQGEYYNIRHRILVDGEVRWVHERARLECDEAGELTTGIGTVQDITSSWRDHLLQETSTSALNLLSQGEGLDKVLTTVTNGLEHINPEMLACILLLEPDGQHFTLGAAPRLDDGLLKHLVGSEAEPGSEFLVEACRTGRKLIVDDLTSCTRWPKLSSAALQQPFQACWCHPVLAKGGRVLGVFTLFYPTPKTPPEADQIIVEQLSMLAGQVIEQTRAQEALHLSSRVIEHSHSAIVVTDAQGYILTTNPAFTQMSGYSKEEVQGRRPAIIRAGLEDDSATRDNVWQRLQDEGFWRGEVRSRHKNGRYYMQWLTASAVKDAAGKVTHYIGISDDITENKEAIKRIDFLAYYDSLTELPNRQLARDRMEQEITRAKREHDGSFALLIVDLDQFKAINDALGHTVGDELIKAAAHRLVDTVRETDTVSRQGGDEFLIMLTGDIEMHAVSAICSKIMEALTRPFEIGEHTLSISASIGVAMFPDDGICFDSLMTRADMAMYSAKDAGRNAYRFFNDRMNVDVMDRILVRNGLMRALEHQEFILHYQPQVDLTTGKIFGVEALIRWENPVIGLVPPDRFIPIAESSGLVVEMGSWVLKEACRQLRNWQDEFGLTDLVMAVNISALQFTRGDLFEAVNTALKESGVSPSSLELELTETVLLKEAEQALEVMSRLRDLGVKMSIDDFGTGYSSMSYLKRLPVDKLKIDRSFVKDIDVDTDDAAIARAVISLGHIMGLSIIAEGVENECQLEFLRLHGCDQYQGYYFSRPLPAPDCGKLLVDQRARPEA